MSATPPPRIGLTMDIDPMDVDQQSAAGAGANPRTFVRLAYHRAIVAAGGWPVPLAPVVELIPAQLDAGAIDAVVFTGGDDPIMEAFGEPTHPAATPVHPQRQQYELALLEALDARHATSVLGVCLGMQYMTLRAGGKLDQHLPETLATAEQHWERQHDVIAQRGAPAWLSSSASLSRHRQAMRDAGRLQVAARAPDGVIEAVFDPARPFYCGVQWHPERSEGKLGLPVYEALVEAARAR